MVDKIGADQTPFLDKKTADKNPLDLFRKWKIDADASEIKEPNAMTVSTVDKNGMPFGRICLLRIYDEDGFVFFTNYKSVKGQQLAENPKAALTIYWSELDRQVNIRGTVEKVSEEISEKYFQGRDRGKQLGAWASDQSSIIENREELENKFKRYTEKYGNDEVIPRPAHWGGYRIIPREIEFWESVSDRLHDRILYSRNGDTWIIERLSP